MGAGDEDRNDYEADQEGQTADWDSEGDGEGDETLETERLALDDEDEALPWLDSADDDDYEEGSDTGRVIGFVLLGLVALAAIVGGIWWASHRSPDPALVADGSTVAAPAEPYKTAPGDPGGKTFDGTGDSSFAVSEGQTRPARLGEAGAAASGTPAATAPKPGVNITAPAAKPSSAAAGAAAAAPATGGVGVQVGAFSSSAAAEAAWTRLAGQHSALSGVRHRVQEGKADIGTVYRLQAVAADAAGAQALCSRLKASGIACQVKN